MTEEATMPLTTRVRVGTLVFPLVFVPALMLLTLVGAQARAGSAKVLMYHHIASSTPASTSVTPEMFDHHLELIATSGYEVVPVQRIIDALINGSAIDSRWVAITFDDAYASIAGAAAPRLQARGWPYTIFVSTEFVGDASGLYMSWDQLRSLEQDGATIANHTPAHEHMVRDRPGENRDDRHSRLAREVLAAQATLTAELVDPLRLFAYPYGEFDDEIANLMQSLGFISFGQQSGPVGRTSNPYALPRFPLGTGFDSVESLAEKLRTEHLPLSNPPIPAQVLPPDAAAPELTLTIDATGDARVRPDSFNCFVAGQPKATVRWLDAHTFKVRAQKPLGSGRTKYTCTAPHPDIRGAYYWHTQLYIKPRADGSWYDG